jgi:hypothetical protein
MTGLRATNARNTQTNTDPSDAGVMNKVYYTPSATTM